MALEDPRDIILRPIVSEKSMEEMARGRYTFVVDPRANKAMIKDAVEEIFGVRVTAVNTMRMSGKKRRVGVFTGRKPNWKKAVVTLAEGQKIELFEGI